MAVAQVGFLSSDLGYPHSLECILILLSLLCNHVREFHIAV
jgi:hypothetical protein